jgi:hypothetical protein
VTRLLMIFDYVSNKAHLCLSILGAVTLTRILHVDIMNDFLVMSARMAMSKHVHDENILFKS